MLLRLTSTKLPLFLVFVALLLAVKTMASEEERERYWSGKPQAVGIDLSPTSLHAVKYDTTTEKFTKLASIEGSATYASFMYQLYELKKSNRRNHIAAYTAFARWSWLRNIVHSINDTAASSRWTNWITAFLPHLLRNEEFRYKFDTELDERTTNPRKSLSWINWVLAALHGQSSVSPKHQSPNFPGLPLTSVNFVDMLASALESIKAECLLKNNVTITSAVISKPQTIYNDLDKLIYRACHKAEIEVLDTLARPDAAMKISSKAGKSAPLVIEQCGYDFNMQRPLSSMNRAELSAAWVPGRLASEMLVELGPVAKGTVESLNDAARRLVIEIARARIVLKYDNAERPNAENAEDLMIVVPDFGIGGFTFTESLPMTSINRVEGEYVEMLQKAIEDMVIHHSDVYEHMKSTNLLGDIDQDDSEALRKATFDFAKQVAHPQVAEGNSWWQPVDSILVLADFPDAGLIRQAAGYVIGSIWSSECKSVFDPSYAHYDLAARGAALDAQTYIADWEEDQQWTRCAEDSTQPECWDKEYEDDSDNEHEEL